MNTSIFIGTIGSSPSGAMRVARASQNVRGSTTATTMRSSKPYQQRILVQPHLQSRVHAMGDEDTQSQQGGLFNDQFMGVLQQSLARQGADALTTGPELDEEEMRASATEEVLEAALNQSKLSLRMMQQWKNQLEAQIAVQEKQVSRMEFALNKSRNDAAYMRSLKQMLHDYSSE
eukprot:jgi/Picre1/28235/NNA_003641.t1